MTNLIICIIFKFIYDNCDLIVCMRYTING